MGKGGVFDWLRAETIECLQPLTLECVFDHVHRYDIMIISKCVDSFQGIFPRHDDTVISLTTS